MKKIYTLKTVFLFILGAISFTLWGQLDTFNFNTCGAEGRLGPTQTQVNAEYLGTNLENKVTINTQGIQEWTVPNTGDFRIIASGAQSGRTDEGYGAVLSGDFFLTQGEVIKILVGQRGNAGLANRQISGGGGSFVAKSPYNTNESILVVAGGGGGRNNPSDTTYKAISDGTISSNGNPGYTTVSLNNGGTNGNGGLRGYIGTHGGGGGAGFFGDGDASGDDRGSCSPDTNIAPASFTNGGVGGWTNFHMDGGDCDNLAREGGFGGGAGAGHYGAAGGGGYSGGGGDYNSGWAGGGGSYNNGSNQVNIAGGNSGHGQVVIVQLCDGLDIEVSPNDTVCPGTIVTLNATSSNGGSISWDNGITNGVAFEATTTATYTATSDNIDDCSGIITITVGDFEDPVLTTKDINLYLDETGSATLVADSVITSASDNCSLADTALDMSLFNCEDIGAHSVTITLTDSAGNKDVETVTVTVMDTIAPSLTVKPDTILYLDAMGAASIAKEDLVLNAEDNCSIADTIISETDFDCTFADSTVKIALTLTDDEGNHTTDTSYISVMDTIKPELNELTLADSIGECSVDTLAAPTATDYCTGTIKGIPDVEFPITSGDTTIVTWSFTDASGNSVTQTQRFILTDDVNPVLDSMSLMNITAVCEVDTILPPTATDACAGKILGTADVSFPITAQDSTEVTWTFDDGNGNSVTQSQWVIIKDTINPTFTMPDDAISCDGTVEGIGVKAASDNCQGNVIITYKLTGATTANGSGDASSETFMEGVTTVTYTVADASGNSLDSSLTVTYEPINTTVTVADKTITASGQGPYQWIDCSDNSIIRDETSQSFTPTESGSYAVVITSGECSDTSTCQAINIVSLDNILLDKELTLYPNPAYNSLNVDLGRPYKNVTIEVVKANGATIVMTEQYSNIKEFSILTSQLASGVYMLQVTTENQRAVFKFIKN
jgi:hypothetical protein